jgi:hypothetical protein
MQGRWKLLREFTLTPIIKHMRPSYHWLASLCLASFLTVASVAGYSASPIVRGWKAESIASQSSESVRLYPLFNLRSNEYHCST